MIDELQSEWFTTQPGVSRRRNALLAMLAGLYGTGVDLRLAAHKRKLLGQQELPGYVVSLGNLTVGGTGKTPAAVMLARWAARKGYSVALLSRGHGGRRRGKVITVSDGRRIMSDPAACGDEPYMLAKKLANVPVVVARKRYLAGHWANKHFGSEFFILDDGYQHLQLKRDLNILLLDAEVPFGNGQLLPRGPLREPLAQLARADAFVLTRCGESRRFEETQAYLADRYPEQPVFLTEHVPDRVVFPGLKLRHSPGFLAGKRVAAFAGIGRPERFRETLVKLGAEVAAFEAFTDHHRFSKAELDELLGKHQELGVEAILTTEKDWARIAPLGIEHSALGYLAIKMTFLSGRNTFYRLVQSRANQAHIRRRNCNPEC